MKFSKTIVAAALFAGVTMTANAADTADITLNGEIVLSTCDIELNNGAATLEVGTYKSQDFVANQQLGSVSLPVSLTNCTDGESGFLKVTGSTASANNEIFTANDGDSVGFMMTYNSAPVVADQNTAAITVTGTDHQEEFLVGMASETVDPAPGQYSAPVTVSYVVQ